MFPLACVQMSAGQSFRLVMVMVFMLRLSWLGALFELFVFFLLFLVDRRNLQATLRGYMTDEADDVPHLVVVQDVSPARHAAEPDTALDDHLQLAVRVILN